MNKLFWSLLSIGSASVGAISFCGGYGLFSAKERDPNVPFIAPPPPGLTETPKHVPKEGTI